MRELLIAKTVAMLQGKGFAVSAFLHSNTCFDLIAKKGETALILKVFDNVDALHESQAIELKKLGTVFNSTILVLGNKTKAFSLKENIIYSRYGISTVNLKTLKNFFAGKIPSINYFKGKEIVELDSEKIAFQRNKLSLSCNDVAKNLGTTIESIYRYEKGAKTTIETAKKLEKLLECDLIKEIGLLEKVQLSEKELFNAEPESEAFDKIQKLGAKIAEFKHAPFSAFSNPVEKIFIAEGKGKNDVRKKVQNLEKTKALIKSHSVIITKNFSTIKPIAKTAIIEEEELGTFSKLNDFLELVREREQSGKNKKTI